MLLLLNGKILHALASIHHYCLSLKHLPCHAHTKFQDTDTITRWCVQWKTRDFTHTCLQKITNGNYLKNFCRCWQRERKKKQKSRTTIAKLFAITSSKSTFLATSFIIDKKATPNSLAWPMLDWRYLFINFNFKKLLPQGAMTQIMSMERPVGDPKYAHYPKVSKLFLIVKREYKHAAETNVRRCSKWFFIKFFQISWRNICVGIFFW